MGTRIVPNTFASWNQELMYEVDISYRPSYETVLWLDQNVGFWYDYVRHGEPYRKLAFRYQKDAALYMLIWG
jgi:hypothetical protein